MTVEELIKQLMDCRSDANVFTSLFDTGKQLSKLSGVSNEGNVVVIFNEISWDSQRNLKNKD